MKKNKLIRIGTLKKKKHLCNSRKKTKNIWDQQAIKKKGETEKPYE